MDQYGLPFAKVEGKPVPLDSGAYTWLRNEMYDREGESCSREQLSEAVGTLAARAAREGTRELHVRAAHVDGVVYVELAPGVVWEIDPLGHRKCHNPPVLFRQDPNAKPLPTPEKGGNLEDLKRFVRLKSERDFRLYTADLVTAFVSDIARPIQNPTGTFGAGKTTLGRITKRLVDPRKPETLRPNKEGFFQNVNKAFVVLVDNEGSLTPELSDTFCRLVTGEGDAARKLYTDDDSIVREKIVKLAINGINAPSARGDFMDRALPFELERIPKLERIAERRLWKEFEEAKPRLLGAVFDALTGGLAEYGPLQNPPRLADWAEYAAAVYEGLGWGREQFLDDWAVIEETQHSTTLEGSPVAAVLKFMEDRDYYEGTAGDLLDELKDTAEDMGLNPRNNKAFPHASNWVWKKIRPVKPTLEGFGIRADQEPRGRGSDKRKVIVLDKQGGAGNPPGGASKNSDADPTDSAQGSAETRGGVSGGSGASKNPPPYDVGVNAESEKESPAYEPVDPRRYRENTDPANPASPKAYESVKSGASTRKNTDPFAHPTDEVVQTEYDRLRRESQERIANDLGLKESSAYPAPEEPRGYFESARGCVELAFETTVMDYCGRCHKETDFQVLLWRFLNVWEVSQVCSCGNEYYQSLETNAPVYDEQDCLKRIGTDERGLAIYETYDELAEYLEKLEKYFGVPRWRVVPF